MDDKIFLPWQEVAYALRRYLYARYNLPAEREFELINGENGLLVMLLKPDGDDV